MNADWWEWLEIGVKNKIVWIMDEGRCRSVIKYIKDHKKVESLSRLTSMASELWLIAGRLHQNAILVSTEGPFQLSRGVPSCPDGSPFAGRYIYDVVRGAYMCVTDFSKPIRLTEVFETRSEGSEECQEAAADWTLNDSRLRTRRWRPRGGLIGKLSSTTLELGCNVISKPCLSVC
jgi:hypothetical protein